MSDPEKVKAVYDWVIQHVEYDTSFVRHGACHALRGRAVCQGYALLIYKMLKSLDIPSLVVNGGDHMWYMVFIEGKWYHLDSTYDDTPEGFLFRKKNTGYDNFLKGDIVMKRNHHVWNRSIYPPAPESYPFR